LECAEIVEFSAQNEQNVKLFYGSQLFYGLMTKFVSESCAGSTGAQRDSSLVATETANFVVKSTICAGGRKIPSEINNLVDVIG